MLRPDSHTQPATSRRSAILDVIALACTILTLTATASILAGASPAYAGSWMEVSCENPNQSAAPSEGWKQFASGTPGYGSTGSARCPMFGLLSSAEGEANGNGENLEYQPPAGSTLIGGSVAASGYAGGHGTEASGDVSAYAPGFVYPGDVIFQCAEGLGACSPGSYYFSGVIALPENTGGGFYIGAGCGGGSGWACNETSTSSNPGNPGAGAWASVEVHWANFLLANETTPTGSGIGGTLLSPNAKGTQELTLNAADPGGPGVYLVTVQIDSKTVYSGTPNNNSGKCVPVGSSGSALMFDYNQPCPTSEFVDLPINTTTVADGQHTLKVTVDDAAQNSSVVYDGTITTDNAPADTSAPTIIASSQVFAGAALSTQPGAWSAPSGAGSIAYGYQWEDCDTQGNNCTSIAGAQNASYTPTPSDVGETLRVVVNASDSDGLASATSAATGVVLSAQGSLGAPNGPGTGSASGMGGGVSAGSVRGLGAPNGTVASETAELRLGIHRAISRTFAQRSFQVTGRLIGSGAHPIGGANLDVLEQVAGSQTLRVIEHTKTRLDGTFALRVPAGPSRLVEVAYRAFTGDAGYAAEAKIEESVDAGVQLNVTPHRTGSTGTIMLSGRVVGPVPTQGVVVELLVHYRGHWEPFRDPRTGSNGRFQVAYQFQGGTGHFPFRAEVFGGQAAFPFTHGDSGAVDVATN